MVSHELGHELGLPDLDARANPGNLMDGTLAPGVRRLPFGSSGYAAEFSALDAAWLKWAWNEDDYFARPGHQRGPRS